MTTESWVLFGVYLGVLLAAVKPLGLYMHALMEAPRIRSLARLERGLFRLCGIRDEEMGWRQYAMAVIAFSVIGFVFVYVLQRLQFWLPLNPQSLPNVTPDSSFNTAISFVTNTNWQAYGGETTMSYLTQMLGLSVQNFVSAATGIAVLFALIRSFTRHSASTIGNFRADLYRATVYLLLPLSFVLALALISEGVVQNFSPYQNVATVGPIVFEVKTTAEAGAVTSEIVTVTEQFLPMGPVASQIAIKQLGTNGGGYFNINSAHLFEGRLQPEAVAEVFEELLHVAERRRIGDEFLAHGATQHDDAGEALRAIAVELLHFDVVLQRPAARSVQGAVELRIDLRELNGVQHVAQDHRPIAGQETYHVVDRRAERQRLQRPRHLSSGGIRHSFLLVSVACQDAGQSRVRFQPAVLPECDECPSVIEFATMRCASGTIPSLRLNGKPNADLGANGMTNTST
jgi:hypothetical protein